jgi:hypothetical protein
MTAIVVSAPIAPPLEADVHQRLDQLGRLLIVEAQPVLRVHAASIEPGLVAGQAPVPALCG